MPDHEKINQVLRKILLVCSQSRTPLDCLAEELGKLPQYPGWSEGDLRFLTAEALRIVTILQCKPEFAPTSIS